MSMSFFPRNLVIYSCLLVTSPVVLFGQATLSPQGSEYAIAGALAGDQMFSQTAINVNGGYLVWQDNTTTPLGLRIRAERLGSSLTAEGSLPFVVSSAAKSKTAGDQEKPQVAVLTGGGAVIVWQSGVAGLRQIYARFLDANGAFIKNDIRVSAHAKNNQSNPVVAALAGGGVVIVWSSDGQDDAQNSDVSLRGLKGVFAQCFTEQGAKSGKEFQVNQWTLNNQRSPAIAALANGNFVVAWVSELERSLASVDIYARIFNASGLAATPEFPINSVTNKVCANPALAGSAQGGFAVAWSQNDNIVVPTPTLTQGQNKDGIAVSAASIGAIVQSTDGWDVFARLYDVNGAPAATAPAPFRLNTYTYGDQFGPKISASGSNYMAVWSSLSQTNNPGGVDPWEGVYGQLVSSSGDLLLNGDVHVNTTTAGRQIQPAITADNANRFLAIWSSMADGGVGFDLFAQIFIQSTP